ncbi:MAG: TetR/AcrR family transcriptional regulator [Pseudomonadota bacterium]
MTDTRVQPQKSVRRAKSGQRVGPRTSRSELSRQRIIDAVIALIFRGQSRFGAVDVAKEAQMGLRTVFNHFDDMDSLYREMDAQVHQKVLLPILLRPYEATAWRDQIVEAAARRAEICEACFPAGKFARSMQTHSVALRESVERSQALERSAIDALVPQDLQERDLLVGAIDVTLSFESWARLRDGAHLGAEEAEKIWVFTTRSLLDQHDQLHP